MKAIATVCAGLRTGSGSRRERFRLVLLPAGLRNPDLTGAPRAEGLCGQNGTVFESVEFGTRNNGRGPTDAELDEWIAGFWWRPCEIRVIQAGALERLNRLPTVPQHFRIQYGYLRTPPDEYTEPRHVVTVRQIPPEPLPPDSGSS